MDRGAWWSTVHGVIESDTAKYTCFLPSLVNKARDSIFGANYLNKVNWYKLLRECKVRGHQWQESEVISGGVRHTSFPYICCLWLMTVIKLKPKDSEPLMGSLLLFRLFQHFPR